MPEQQTIGTYYFKLTIGGHEAAGVFKECTGLQSEQPGPLQWSNIALKRGVDSNGDLWKWRQEVINGEVASARKDGTVEVVDWEGKSVLTYSFARGWPCKYSAPGLSAGGNDILIEEIEIAHEGFDRVS
jgi:phage tail-like protein